MLQNVGVFLLNVPHFAQSHVAGLVRIGDNRRAAIAAGGAQMVQAAQMAALALPVADRIVDEIELRKPAEILNRENRRENGLQAPVFALARQLIHLQEALIGLLLNVDQVRDLDRGLEFWQSPAVRVHELTRLPLRLLIEYPLQGNAESDSAEDTRPVGPGRTLFEVLYSKGARAYANSFAAQHSVGNCRAATT